MSAGFTPGPWRWFGNASGVYLAANHSGRRYVMGFKRQGMNGAQPTFQVADRMAEASELVTFEVGDGTARGFKQGKADESVYRLCVSGIDAPDAYLIAAAPDLYKVGKALLEAAERHIFGDECRAEREAFRAALAAARGGAA